MSLKQTMILRPATIEDAEVLLTWRNDDGTREAFHDSGPVSFETHMNWLIHVIASPSHKISMAVDTFSGCLLGTVRATYSQGQWVLSWTVAPEARGRGIAKKMVRDFVKGLSGEVRAEVKKWNSASVKVANSAGLSRVGEDSECFIFELSIPDS